LLTRPRGHRFDDATGSLNKAKRKSKAAEVAALSSQCTALRASVETLAVVVLAQLEDQLTDVHTELRKARSVTS
jgi:hypothetical protein